MNQEEMRKILDRQLDGFSIRDRNQKSPFGQVIDKLLGINGKPLLVGVLGGDLIFTKKANRAELIACAPDALLDHPNLVEAISTEINGMFCSARHWGAERFFLGRSLAETIDACLTGRDGAEKCSGSVGELQSALHGWIAARKAKMADVERKEKDASLNPAEATSARFEAAPSTKPGATDEASKPTTTPKAEA